jgi:cysteine desulfurase
MESSPWLLHVPSAARHPGRYFVLALYDAWTENFANPGSVEHALGRAAGEAVEEARTHVADLIGADAKEIILTSGATEANNLAIKGAARFAAVQGSDRRRIVTVATDTVVGWPRVPMARDSLISCLARRGASRSM